MHLIDLGLILEVVMSTEAGAAQPGPRAMEGDLDDRSRVGRSVMMRA